MKKLSIVLIAAACLLGACKKEDQKEKVVLGTAIEEVNSNQKAYIDNDRYVCFAANDVVKVNNEDATISADGRTGNLSVTRTSSYNAVYPKSILVHQNSAVPTTNVQVVLPSEQTYVTKTMGGTTRQVVDMPMAGYLGSETGTIEFHNLCSVLRVIIHNNKTIPLGVKSITVRASDAFLCGAGTIADITGNTAAPQIEMSRTNTAVQNEVTLQMTAPVNVAVNSSKEFYIVIPAIPSTATSNKFTVEVIADSTSNNIAYANRYSKTQGSGKTGYIARNKLGSAAFHLDPTTPPDRPYITLDCQSNNVSKRIIFAPGNLQYQASSNSWQFAPNTYDFVDGVDIHWDNSIGHMNTYYVGLNRMTANNTPLNQTTIGSTSVAGTRATQSGWIDLFGWGTSGKVTGLTGNYAAMNLPYAVYNANYGGVNYSPFYGPTSGNLTGNWDWGANSIYNPKTGVNETGWYTLSKAEWDCLVESNQYYGYACLTDLSYRDVNNTLEYVSGIVLIPKGFLDPMCASTNNGKFMASSNFGSNQEGFFTQNQYTTTSWKKMEAAGAVFLPTAGYRDYIGVQDASSNMHGGQVLQYWTSTSYDGYNAYMFRSENGDAANSVRVHTGLSQRCAGTAVRLAKEVQ